MDEVVDQIEFGDCVEIMNFWANVEGVQVNTCVTSPPYWGLRDYGVDGQLGLEKTPQEYIEKMVEVFRAVRRVLRDDGTVWLNLGDSYAASTKGSGGTAKGTLSGGGGQSTNAGSFYDAKFDLQAAGLKPKDLCGIPWRVALALQADGWYLRQDIIWHKPNPMPESVRDRCTKAHEYIFLLAKSPKYYYDHEAIKEPATGRNPGNKRHKGKEAYDGGDEHHRTKAGLTSVGAKETRNKRSVWTVAPKAYKGAHFAVFPPDLIEPCVLAGCPEGGIVLDPFMGSGTTAMVARDNGRRYLGCELNPEYSTLQEERLK